MIWVNFKTYPQGTGEKAVELAKLCEEISRDTGVEIVPIVQAVDLFLVAKEVSLPIWVQHVDPFPQGKFTGWINLEAVVEDGGKGSLLNHAERQIPPGTVKQVIKGIERLKTAGKFELMVCAKTMGQAEKLAKLKPDFLAYEPPELIGGNLSVSEAEPGVITRIVKKISDIPIVVGAGIKSGKDVKRSLALGAVGVLVSSGVVLAKNQEETLEDLVSGFKI
ncbi:MAG: triose-phosphate isomerase [bacterium]|nr:triose-phosphate isomerase [bacterium]